MSFEFKRLDVSDPDMAVGIASLFAGNDVSSSHVATFLADESNVLVAALEAGEPVGFLNGHILERFKDTRRKFFIYEIDVLAPSRRNGAGLGMITLALEIAAANGCDTAFVLTNCSNKAATGLYKRTGDRSVHLDDVMFEYALG